MIHAASRAALDALRERLNEVLAGTGRTTRSTTARTTTRSTSTRTRSTAAATRAAAADDALAAELYSVANLLTGQPRLRRTLGDPSTDASGRGELIRSLLGSQLSESATDLVATAVEQRWSSPWDLTDALEIAGDESLLASAEAAGTLDEVEDELFRFERILAGAGDLTAALDEVAVPAERRIELLSSVLADKVHPVTLELLSHSVASGRKRSLELAIDDLLEASAVRRNRSVARVISARELTAAQSERLTELLSELYGRPISVRSAIDPNVQGGLVVRVGDEVIDGSVATKLAQARTALAG